MSEPAAREAGLLVVRPGIYMTIQDLGRPGLAHLGVPGSGAADVTAHTLANALVGNDANAATLEVTAGGCEIQARQDVTVAVTGARVPMWVGWVPAPFGSPVRLRAGQILELGVPTDGLRSYIAVRGGVDVPPVLGSRATDALSGLGPDVLASGAVLPIGQAPHLDQAGFNALRRLAVPTPAQGDDEHDPARASAVLKVRVRLGPRDDWFTRAGIEALFSQPYEVTADSNRVGVRLAGAAFDRAIDGELESEGLVTGAVQVPASGQPVIFLADHPVTGGYPVIAVVEPEDVPRVAQARPGDSLRFEAVTPLGV